MAAVGEFVVFGAAIVFGGAPAGFDPAAAFEAVEGGIEGALLNLENVAGNLLYALGDGPAVLGFEGEGAEDEEVEGALRKIDALRHLLPLSFDRKDTTTLVEAQGESWRWRSHGLSVGNFHARF